MAQTGADGRRRGEARPELKGLVDETGVVPRTASLDAARTVLAEDGVVRIPDVGNDPEVLVVAAAHLLGGRLRELFGIRPQGGTDSPVLGLHNDGAYLEGDVHGRTVRLRDPDEDFLLMHCSVPAPSGGDSVLVDGYALVDRLAVDHPDLHAFLTGADTDFFGARVNPPRGVPDTPLLRRMVEYTRGGRRTVRASDYALPVPRVPEWDEHLDRIEEYADLLATAFDAAPRFRLEAGDLLVLDNYRFLHGRDAFSGSRTLHVLSVRTTEAF
ncbi:TauD/TfdA family dioxygenase [Pseudonocardia parietis]|uniref:Gamma-butyrobetaine dioxygenase n=1 Tax=Pseudonocardia parietis TaxID=570936 RepID=A0ABS4VM55_9PSEU|nr:TauD/TfdA family dioxygenase [Pseudonocardia parietis]MBP2364992.1 gamma-butyrobetaine dioxygenase [Pseudonocardia parietis]